MTSLNLSGFPLSGSNSLSSYIPISSGLVRNSELRNLLDITWSKDAVQRAVSSVKGSLNGFDSTCLGGNGIYNQNLNDAARSYGSFNLPGMGSIFNTSHNSLLGLLGNLEVGRTLTSLTGGLASMISNTASSIFALLDRALSAPIEKAKKLVSLASRVIDASSRAIDLFTSAYDMAMNGVIGLGNIDPGELLSGAMGWMVDKAGAVIGGMVDGVANLIGRVSSLGSELLEYGISFFEAPMAKMGEIASYLSGIAGSIKSSLGGLISELGAMASSAIDKIASLVGKSLTDILGSISGLIEGAVTSITDGINATVERIQGLKFLDGAWLDGIMSGLKNIFKMFSTPTNNRGSGSWGLAGLLGSNDSNSVSSMLLASLLGAKAPTVSDYLSGMVDPRNGMIVNGNAAIGSITSILSSACAFNAALGSALNHFLNSGGSLIDALMSMLECRRSGYTVIGDLANGTKRVLSDIINRLMGIINLLTGFNFGAICPSNGLLPGACSV